jgi:hypothetical protein
MIDWEFYAPAAWLDPHGPSASVEYSTNDETDFLEIDEQIYAMFLGYL